MRTKRFTILVALLALSVFALAAGCREGTPATGADTPVAPEPSEPAPAEPAPTPPPDPDPSPQPPPGGGGDEKGIFEGAWRLTGTVLFWPEQPDKVGQGTSYTCSFTHRGTDLHARCALDSITVFANGTATKETFRFTYRIPPSTEIKFGGRSTGPDTIAGSIRGFRDGVRSFEASYTGER